MTIRLRALGRDEVDEDVGGFYDEMEKKKGNVPRMYRILARSPELMKTLSAHAEAVVRGGAAPAKLKELAIVRTSQINGCGY